MSNSQKNSQASQSSEQSDGRRKDNVLLAPPTAEEAQDRMLREQIETFQSFALERRVDPDAVAEHNNYFQQLSLAFYDSHNRSENSSRRIISESVKKLLEDAKKQATTLNSSSKKVVKLPAVSRAPGTNAFSPRSPRRADIVPPLVERINAETQRRSAGTPSPVRSAPSSIPQRKYMLYAAYQMREGVPATVPLRAYDMDDGEYGLGITVVHQPHELANNAQFARVSAAAYASPQVRAMQQYSPHAEFMQQHSQVMPIRVGGNHFSNGSSYREQAPSNSAVWAVKKQEQISEALLATSQPPPVRPVATDSHSPRQQLVKYSVYKRNGVL